ncbi:kinase-like protein [Heliocybe sulcata]|uniref:Kinase-like protein n=1 Tax=Heliocybe sulcata TaxID=5364 RepID=A0A5C3N9F8_9AGAM|nr:kinase-like protein [Heliocybe sulcata]
MNMMNLEDRKKMPVVILALPKDIVLHFLNMLQFAIDEARLWEEGSDLNSPARVLHPFRMHCYAALRRLSFHAELVPSVLYLQGRRMPTIEGSALATGSFAQVFRGKWLGRTVAQKRFHPAYDPDEQERKRLRCLREIVLWRQLSHKNVLPLLGIFDVGGTDDLGELRLAMVSPWAHNANVINYVTKQGGNPTSILAAVADVLSYMHAHDPPMVHGDIHPGNILIDKYGHPLVTDFGLSRFHGSSTTNGTSGDKGPDAYRPPEHWDLTQPRWEPTTYSDMYSFGCLCFHIYALRAPWQGRTPRRIEISVKAGERPERPSEGISDPAWVIIQSCWVHESKRRMSSTEAWVALKRLGNI